MTHGSLVIFPYCIRPFLNSPPPVASIRTLSLLEIQTSAEFQILQPSSFRSLKFTAERQMYVQTRLTPLCLFNDRSW
jgi:hypothetical protein